MANRRMKLTASFLLFLFTVGAMVTFSSIQTSEADPEKVFVIGMSQIPISLNPILSTSAYDLFATELVYETLIYDDPDTWTGSGEFKPQLASSWDVDGLEYTFHLDEDARWHDGEDVDAYDCLFSYDIQFYCVDEGYQDNETTNLEYLHAYWVEDEDTFVVQAREEFAPILDTFTILPILPEHFYNETTATYDPFSGDIDTDIVSHPSFLMDEKPIGSGQYEFYDYDDTTGTVTLEKNTDYYRGTVEVDKVKFVEYSADALRVAALQAGEADLIDTVPGASVPTLEEDSDVVVDIVSPGATFRTYTLNCYKEPWSVKEVRQGFQMNINRTYIIEYVMGGYARLCNAHILASSWAYNTAIDDMWPYNQTAALELWDSVGFKDGGALDQTANGDGKVADMTIMYNIGNTPRQQITDYMKTRFAALPDGYKIDITVEAVDWADIYRDGMGVDPNTGAPIYDWDPKSWDGYMVGLLANSPDPDDYSVFSSGDVIDWPPPISGKAAVYNDYRELWTPLGFQLPLWYNETWETTSIDARTTIDRTTRINLYHEIQEIVAEEIPMGFLYTEDDIYAYRAEWEGIDMGLPPFTVDLGINLRGPGEEEDNTLLYVGVGAIAAVVIAAVVIFMRKRGAE